ncbi:MAG TPA: fumarylacetoacetate hydrolase family protein [Anaerolineales bacterium]|nr:fumarylacetoacetate hydrolase family protein [Anaerolineales bacterium]
MRFVTFTGADAAPRIGVLETDRILDLTGIDGLPPTMLGLIESGAPAWETAGRVLRERGVGLTHSLDAVQVRAPLPRPPSFRDFYAFEAHVRTAFANRGREIPQEWYKFPAFYFSNPGSVLGPEERVAAPPGSEALDYELEVACIVGVGGRDIAADRAEGHIFGYTILNDWSARDLQQAEMRIGLGPAKGKDFASSLGPWIVTPDELADRSSGRAGVYDLAMSARINGVERSRGNWKDLYYSFGEMIARASAGVDLFPGDVIGSGTVGTGSLLELTRGEGPWLRPGDVVELEIERLGTLRNTVAGDR